MSMLDSRRGSPDLWLTRPSEPSFANILLGYSELPSALSVIDKSGSKRARTTAWGTPVVASLFDQGPLLVKGERRQGQHISSGFLLSLAASHSPEDLEIAIASSTSGPWEWPLFLPHLLRSDGSSRISGTAAGASALIEELDRLVKQRRESSTGRSSEDRFPSHTVVIVDDDHSIDGALLSRVLTDGPSVGVTAIVIRDTGRPEGITSVLEHRGLVRSDTIRGFKGSFTSSTAPKTDEISFCAVTPKDALAAARSLAPLRPMGKSFGSSSVSERLLDQISLQASADAVEQRWKSLSPTTSCHVGMAGENTAFAVDIRSRGPHGVIAGTTGSGKTEFLKTLVAGLALSNHPDDLSFVIADFKDAGDHDLHRLFPHVVDVATNKDMAGFVRQVDLLDAERQRRSRLFKTPGVNNLGAYQVAQRERPDELPPIPCLLVIVDEFAELAADPEGAQQLKRFVSIARTGRAFGIHLLLVTQRPGRLIAGDLDANMAMRFCFRVEKADESKDLIGTAQSKAIAPSNPGFGYAKFASQAPIGFQSARVAGPRPDRHTTPVVTSPDELGPVSAETASSLPPKAVSVDVPDEEQDLSLIAEIIRGAAKSQSWDRSAIPWPAAQTMRPPIHAVLEVARRAHTTGVPIGLLDVPSKQSRELCTIPARSGTIALVGDDELELGDAALTVAVAAMTTFDSGSARPVYGIDFIGGLLRNLGDIPWVGGLADDNDVMANRILKLLASQPRADAQNAGPILVVNGVQRLHGMNNEVSELWPVLLSVIQEAQSKGIFVIATGTTPTLLRGKHVSSIAQRLIFRHNNDTYSQEAGLPKELGSQLGDYSFFEATSGSLGKLASLPTDPSLAIRQFGAFVKKTVAHQHFPQKLSEVPYPLAMLSVPKSPSPKTVVLGLDPHSEDPVAIEPDEDGKLFVVAGGKGTGKSTALLSIAELAEKSGLHVIRASLSSRSPLADLAKARIGEGEVLAIETSLNRPSIVVIDDLHRASDLDGDRLKAIVNHKQCRLCVIAVQDQWLDSRPSTLRDFRRPAMSGVLLASNSSAFVREHFGLSPNKSDLGPPMPGIGVGVLAHEIVRIQFALPAQ